MRRKAHGERFSLRGERRSLLGKTKLGGGETDSACAENGKTRARKGKITLGKAKSVREMQSSRGENPGSRGERKTCSEEPQARSEKDEAWAKNGEARAAGKAPPFEFLPLLSTCPLGGHATPWFTAPWISAPLASLFLDFFHPLNSCHLLVLHSFTPAYWVSDYPFLIRDIAAFKATCASFQFSSAPAPFPPLPSATRKSQKLSFTALVK